MIKLNWLPLRGADILSYRVYRSMIGFKATLASPASVAGLSLILALNNGTAQTITFSGTDDIITQINAQLEGGKAYAAADPDAAYFFVRSDLREAPGSIEIFDSPALIELNLTARLITERSEDLFLTTVAALTDETLTVVYPDPDGVAQDYYAVSTVNHLTDESAKSAYRQAVTTTGNICVLEGIVEDLSGRRIADAKVTATLLGTPQQIAFGGQVSMRPLRTLSGPDGRYSVAVLQGMIIRLEIPLIGYSRAISVPTTLFAFVSDLDGDDAAQLKIDDNLGRL